MAFRGALVQRASPNDQFILHGEYGTVAFDTVLYDTDGFFDLLEGSKFVVPQGVTYVRLTAQVIWEHNTKGYRQLLIYKNGYFFPGDPVLTILPVSVTTTDMPIVSPVVKVVPGDEFILKATHTALSLYDPIDLKIPLKVLGATGTYFGIEVLE